VHARCESDDDEARIARTKRSNGTAPVDGVRRLHVIEEGGKPRTAPASFVVREAGLLWQNGRFMHCTKRACKKRAINGVSAVGGQRNRRFADRLPPGQVRHYIGCRHAIDNLPHRTNVARFDCKPDASCFDSPHTRTSTREHEIHGFASSNYACIALAGEVLIRASG
jgi:hypothetical protein